MRRITAGRFIEATRPSEVAAARVRVIPDAGASASALRTDDQKHPAPIDGGPPADLIEIVDLPRAQCPGHEEYRGSARRSWLASDQSWRPRRAAAGRGCRSAIATSTGAPASTPGGRQAGESGADDLKRRDTAGIAAAMRSGVGCGCNLGVSHGRSLLRRDCRPPASWACGIRCSGAGPRRITFTRMSVLIAFDYND